MECEVSAIQKVASGKDTIALCLDWKIIDCNAFLFGMHLVNRHVLYRIKLCEAIIGSKHIHSKHLLKSIAFVFFWKETAPLFY